MKATNRSGAHGGLTPERVPPVDFVRSLLPKTFEHAVAVVVALALLLRLTHLFAASRSPLNAQLGPDEDYYLRFAQDVADGSGGLLPEFAFMDPLYGYMLGIVIKATGSPFPMYGLQVLVDTGTTLMLALIGRALGRPKVGLAASGIYAFVGPAIAMTAALLKEIWVAAYLCGWVLAALHLLRSERSRGWTLFGVYCGLGVLLRSNLILLVIGALLVFPLAGVREQLRFRTAAMRAGLLAAGLALPLAAAALRNHAIEGRASPMPTNGGVVLHQLHNPENPRSRSTYPSFVRYAHPSEAWRAYRAEAERRLGRKLTAAQIDAYWRSEAFRHLRENPRQEFLNVLRRLAEFSAYPEVPNNRSYADERQFSPVLRALPPPFGLLFALGLPGLALLLRWPSHAWLLWLPTLAGVATVALFFAEDRFRLVVVPFFAFGAAVWLALLARAWKERRIRVLALSTAVSMALGAWSYLWGMQMPAAPTNWQRVATGWFKMGQYDRVRTLLDEVAARDPRAVGVHEFRGLLALAEGRPREAREDLERALSQRQDRHEVWHNYARALVLLGQHDEALVAQVRAYQLSSEPEYLLAIAQSLERLGRLEEAIEVYRALAGNPEAGRFGIEARKRLAAMPTRSPAS